MKIDKYKIIDLRKLVNNKSNKLATIFNTKSTLPSNFTLKADNIESYLRSGAWLKSESNLTNVVSLLQNISKLIEDENLNEEKVSNTVINFLFDKGLVYNWNAVESAEPDVNDTMMGRIKYLSKLNTLIFAYSIAVQEFSIDKSFDEALKGDVKTLISLYDTLYNSDDTDSSTLLGHLENFAYVYAAHNITNSSIPYIISSSRVYAYLNGYEVDPFDEISEYTLICDNDGSILDLDKTDRKFNAFMIRFCMKLYKDHKDKIDSSFFKVILDNKSISILNPQSLGESIKHDIIPYIDDNESDEIVYELLSKLPIKLEVLFKPDDKSRYMGFKNTQSEIRDLAKGFSQGEVKILTNILSNITSERKLILDCEKEYALVKDGTLDIELNTKKSIALLIVLRALLNEYNKNIEKKDLKATIETSILKVYDMLINLAPYASKDDHVLYSYNLGLSDLMLVNSTQLIRAKSLEYLNVINNIYKSFDIYSKLIFEALSRSEISVSSGDSAYLDSLVTKIKSMGYKDDEMARVFISTVKLSLTDNDMNNMDTVLGYCNYVCDYVLPKLCVNVMPIAIEYFINDIKAKLTNVDCGIAGHDIKELYVKLTKIKIRLMSNAEWVEAIDNVLAYLSQVYADRYHERLTFNNVSNSVLFITTIFNKNYMLMVDETNGDLYEGIINIPKKLDVEAIDDILDGTVVPFDVNNDKLRLNSYHAILVLIAKTSQNKTDIMNHLAKRFTGEINSNYSNYNASEIRLALNIGKVMERLMNNFDINLHNALFDLYNNKKDYLIREGVEDKNDGEYFNYDPITKSYGGKKKETTKEEPKKKDDKKKPSPKKETKKDDESEDDYDDDDFEDEYEDDIDDDDDDWETYNEDPEVNKEAVDPILIEALLYESLLKEEYNCYLKGYIRHFSLTESEKRNRHMKINPYDTPSKIMGQMFNNLYLNEEAASYMDSKETKYIIETESRAKNKENKSVTVKKTGIDKIKTGADKVASGVSKGKDFAGNLLADLAIIKNKISDKVKKVPTIERNVSNKIDGVFNRLTDSLKAGTINNNREAIINGRLLPSFTRLMKLGLTGGALVVFGQPILGLITLIGGVGASVKANKAERRRISDELEVQRKVVEKKIKIAEENNDMESYAILLKIKQRIISEYNRINYKTKAARAAMSFDSNDKED